MATELERGLAAIDAAHSLDPNKIDINGSSTPYELHYAQKCTSYLEKRLPDASEPLQLAVRAQHFRRWETPRSDYPMTRPGYYSWRINAKQRQAQLVQEICIEVGYSQADAERVAALIRKEDLKLDEETQALEDVACLVFLDDQFEAFSKDHDEDKILGILRKTWGKMSKQGQDMALAVKMDVESERLMEKALNG